MDFRWKVPELKPNFVDPQGVRSTMAAQQMQGYAPNAQAMNAANAMQGYKPNVPTSSAFNNEQLAQQNYDSFNSELQEKKQRLATLEQQLMKIDSDLAQLQQGGADEEKAIAAKLAEIGDTSLYQGILAREQNQAAQQKSSSTGINNLLFEADKLSWGLNSKSDEERTIARNEIRVNLEKAKYMADQTGTPLPDKYYQLKARLEQGTEPNGEAPAEGNAETLLQKENTLSQLDRTNQLSDNDLEPLATYLADKGNRNKQEYKKVEELYNKYKNRTVETKRREQEASRKARDLVLSKKDSSDKERLRWWNSLSDKVKSDLIKRGYTMDTEGKILYKGGII